MRSGYSIIVIILVVAIFCFIGSVAAQSLLDIRKLDRSKPFCRFEIGQDCSSVMSTITQRIVGINTPVLYEESYDDSTVYISITKVGGVHFRFREVSRVNVPSGIFNIQVVCEEDTARFHVQYSCDSVNVKIIKPSWFVTLEQLLELPDSIVCVTFELEKNQRNPLKINTLIKKVKDRVAAFGKVVFLESGLYRCIGWVDKEKFRGKQYYNKTDSGIIIFVEIHNLDDHYSQRQVERQIDSLKKEIQGSAEYDSVSNVVYSLSTDSLDQDIWRLFFEQMHSDSSVTFYVTGDTVRYAPSNEIINSQSVACIELGIGDHQFPSSVSFPKEVTGLLVLWGDDTAYYEIIPTEDRMLTIIPRVQPEFITLEKIQLFPDDIIGWFRIILDPVTVESINKRLSDVNKQLRDYGATVRVVPTGFYYCTFVQYGRRYHFPMFIAENQAGLQSKCTFNTTKDGAIVFFIAQRGNNAELRARVEETLKQYNYCPLE